MTDDLNEIDSREEQLREQYEDWSDTLDTTGDALTIAQRVCHGIAVHKGFYENPPSFGDRIALMHSELSEALEGFRTVGLEGSDKHCPEHSNVAVELADVIVRILDCAEYLDLDVGAAFAAKVKFNMTRPHKHGKKF